MQPQFTLESTPAPKRRTARGQIERGTIAYQIRDHAYNAVENAMRAWRTHRPMLPPKAAAALGIKSTAAFVRLHRNAFRGIMRHLNVTSPKGLLRRYGRTGEAFWNWDHQIPLREANHFKRESMEQILHATNLRPILASRNHWKKWELPLDHAELFTGEGAP